MEVNQTRILYKERDYLHYNLKGDAGKKDNHSLSVLIQLYLYNELTDFSEGSASHYEYPQKQ